MFGMPRRLLFGYLALAVFMTGDGFELTFLSRFLVESGFSPTQAGLVFTVYGLVVAFSAWTTGVLAEVVGARRLMVLGGVLWMVLHVLFLTVGLRSVVGTILIYSLRGVAYPLFMYSFVVLIAQSVHPSRLASAMGWYWASFSLGLGVMGAYVPSLLVPVIGEYATLWASLIFVAAGTALCAFLVPGAPPEADRSRELAREGRARELLRGATLAFAYFPVWFGASFPLMIVPAVLFALSVTAFVPMGAIFPALAPEHRGAAISAHNLASGLTTFAGPGIATALLPVIGPIGVCWAFAGLMVLGTITTFFIHPPQPGITTEAGRVLPRRERLTNAA